MTRIATDTGTLLAATIILVVSIGQSTGQLGLAPRGGILNCANLLTKLDFHYKHFHRYNEFFREDSVMTLAQAGQYTGAEGIREYVGFIHANTSPYFSESVEADAGFLFKEMKGSLCVSLTFSRYDYSFNSSTAASAAKVGVVLMSKIYYDPVENYIPKIHIYYAEPFLALFFGQMLSSRPTFGFLCDEVLHGSCGMDIPNCLEKLESLPSLTKGGYADGNSRACQVLHGAFALSNPDHCPHVAFDATPDPKGAIKCQSSSNRTVSSLFDESDLALSMEWSATFGINGSIGYTTEPYYKTFQREYEDTMQFMPPVSSLLQTMVVPGVAKDTFTNNPPKCPAFQNDTTYWTDFAAIELSDTHIDYFDHRRMPGDRVFGPGTCTVSHVGTEGIHKKLKDMPQRLMEGTAYRANEVGKNRLNSHTFAPGIWSEEYVGMALGAPSEDHDSFRPVLDYLFGDGKPLGESLAENGNQWTYKELVESARDYLADKERIDATIDPSIWTLKMLHQIALGTDPTEKEMDNFRNLRDLVVAVAFLEGESVERLATSIGMSLELVIHWKMATVGDYEKLLSTNPVIKELLLGNDPMAIKKASWAVFDAFLFAGGVSVPNVILHCMASYYSGFDGKDDFNVYQTISLKLLVMEAIRRYPPVSSVPILDARDHHRILPFISAAGYDEAIYGNNVTEFRIRGDLQWYHNHSVSFAEPALPVEGFPGSARICPGRSLAVAMAAAWLEAMGLDGWHVAQETPIKRIPLEFANFELVKGTGKDSSGACTIHSRMPKLTVGSFLLLWLLN